MISYRQNDWFDSYLGFCLVATTSRVDLDFTHPVHSWLLFSWG
jgi:hypothetical protein